MSNFFTELAREYTGNQSKHDILFTNIQNGKGIRVMPEETKQQPEWISTGEAAEIMEVTQTTVSRLCREGKLKCRQYGEGKRSIWEVHRDAAENYEKSVGGRGHKYNL